MACPEPIQLVLYLTTYGLDERERQRLDKHLAECQACRNRMNRFKEDLNRADLENQKECHSLRTSLVAYVSGELPEKDAAKFLSHASECPTCTLALRNLATFLSLEDVASVPIQIPSHLRGTLQSALNDRLKQAPPPEKRRKVKERIAEKAEDAKGRLREIRLRLTPLEALPSFRGQGPIRKSNLVDVDHPGGDLIIDVGSADVVVELYSGRGKYLDDQESDETGKVTFSEMKPGKYKIRVHGHHIGSPE